MKNNNSQRSYTECPKNKVLLLIGFSVGITLKIKLKGYFNSEYPVLEAILKTRFY